MCYVSEAMASAARILLATTNPAKAAKLRWVLEGLPLRCIPLSQLSGDYQVSETGASFEENARLKALAGSRAFDGLAIASDGGLSIPALGAQWDHLFTARAAGAQTTDEGRARHLLALLQGKQRDERRVFWTEALAIAQAGKVLASWEEAGTEGYLTETYDPANAIPGFWVYSLWWFPQLGKRYVELAPEELEAVDVTWRRLRERVRGFCKGKGSSPLSF